MKSVKTELTLGLGLQFLVLKTEWTMWKFHWKTAVMFALTCFCLRRAELVLLRS